VPRRSREDIIQSLPPQGQLHQNSRQHLDLLYALAYPDREKEAMAKAQKKDSKIEDVIEDSKIEEHDFVATSTGILPHDVEDAEESS
jgi:hypothetical protein